MENLAFSMENFWKIYYYIALFATTFFVIKLIIFSFFGGGSEVGGDFNTEFDTDTSFDFLSIQSILAFLMGFGWSGYSALQQFNLGQIWAFLIACAVGFIFMATTAYLMFSVKKLEKNVKKDKNTAIGKIGKAYTHFEPKGNGQIEINVNEQLMVVDAVNTTDEEIKAFENVKVTKVENEVMYVEKGE